MPPPSPREWLLRLEQEPGMWSRLLEECGLSVAAHAVAVAKLRVHRAAPDPGPPTPAELRSAALEIAMRAPHNGPIPTPEQLASECEHCALPVMR